MPIDYSYLQYNKVYPNKHQQFHISKISGNPNINVDASNLVIDASLISINSDIDLSGNIIPTINETFDLGSPEFRFRDLFLSNASIWLGDNNKISINSDGKFSSKKRKTTIIPAFIRNHLNGHSVIPDLLNYYFGSGHSKTINDMKLKDWKDYTIKRGIRSIKTFDIREVFSDNTSEDWEIIEEGINENDLITALYNLNIDICNNNVEISGNFIANGSVSATTFYGDGSNLTGISSSGGGSSNLNNFSNASLGNVEISGNLLMNGRIDFFASNEQLASSDASGILNRIDNLLISYNDASFGNTDITGDLNVNGDISATTLFSNTIISSKIGLGHTTDYGNAGAVLTSNGPNASASWTAPVYVAVLKNGDKTVNAAGGGSVFSTIDNMTIEYQGGGSNYNEATGEFTAPRAGIYIIDYAINTRDEDSPYYHNLITGIVSVNRGSGYVREMRQDYADLDRQTWVFTLRNHYMTYLNAGDKVKNELEIYNTFATVATIRGNSTLARATYQSIYSIT